MGYRFQERSSYREYLRQCVGKKFEDKPKEPPAAMLADVQSRFLSITGMKPQDFQVLCMVGWYGLAARGGHEFEHYHFSTHTVPTIDDIVSNKDLSTVEATVFKAACKKFLLEDYYFFGTG